MVSSSAKLGGGPKLMFSLGETLSRDFDIFYALPKNENFSVYLKDFTPLPITADTYTASFSLSSKTLFFAPSKPSKLGFEYFEGVFFRRLLKNKLW